MPSSTSSSRAPKGRWWLTWLLTLIVVAGFAAVAEALLRSMHFRPSVPEEPAIWALQRSYAVGSRPVVLVGASRMQLDVDPAVLSNLLDRPVVDLAIPGSNPVPVLDDLANDERFRGDVWMSLRVQQLLGNNAGVVQEYLTYFHHDRPGLNKRLNTIAVAEIDSRLALRTAIKPNWLKGFYLWSYTIMRPDRFREADFSMVTIRSLRSSHVHGFRAGYHKWADRMPGMDVFDDSLAALERRVQAIQERGGQVTFIRFPVGPALWAMSDSVFSREIYWDRLAASTSAKTIHYRDYQSLNSYEVPDESHLDKRDVASFTRELAKIVLDR